jgi:diguanylate cyclase (GGDEF)-like protein
VRSWLVSLDRKLEETSDSSLERVVLTWVAVLGLIDYLSGFEAAFSFFYLIPVSMAAWYGRYSFSYLVAVLCAGTGQLANDLAGEPHSHLIVAIWNDLIQLFFFLTVALLLQRIRQLLMRAKRMSQQDFLTGLMNKRALTERLSSELARASRANAPLVLGFIDLDHFKTVNDQLGHSEGDRLLFLVSQCMNEVLRRSDTLDRVGGDEFAVILPECSPAAARIVAGKLLNTISTLSSQQGWPVSASLGLIHIENPRAFEDTGALLQAADAMMYEAKSAGRNCYRLRSC